MHSETKACKVFNANILKFLKSVKHDNWMKTPMDCFSEFYFVNRNLKRKKCLTKKESAL